MTAIPVASVRTNVDPGRALLALRAEVERVVRLLRTVGPPGDSATVGLWAGADVAMHLSQAWIAVPAMAAGDLAPVHDLLPDLEAASPSLMTDIWDLGGVTSAGVRADPERNLHVLADRIASRAEAFFAKSAGLVGSRRPWMVQGVEVPFSTLVCHLLNETIVHGYDVAAAARAAWAIEPSHAAMALDGFVIPVIAALPPRAMVDQKAAAGLRATYDLRIRGGDRHIFAFDDGALAIDKPNPPRVDCHISADPEAMLLVAWNRLSQWPAIGKGQLMAWGRKPWLGFKFRSLMRNP